MADKTNIKWLYPPNFEGTYEPETKQGPKRYIVQCTNYSDGTGESDSIKVKRTDLLTFSGQTPSRLIIEKIEYDITGMGVRISYNNMNDEEVAVLQDSVGCIDFTSHGGFVPMDDGEGLAYTGDIVFDTIGAQLGHSYNIALTVRPKN